MQTDLLIRRFVAFARRTGVGGLVVLAAATATAVFLAGTIVSPSLRQRSVDVARGVSTRLQEAIPGFDRQQDDRTGNNVASADGAPSDSVLGDEVASTGSSATLSEVSSGGPEGVLAVGAPAQAGSKTPEGVELDTDAARPGGGGGQTGGGSNGTTDPVDEEVPTDNGGGGTGEGEAPQPEEPVEPEEPDEGSEEEPVDQEEKPSKAPKPAKPAKPSDDEEPVEPEEPTEPDEGEDDDRPAQAPPKVKAPKEKEKETEPGDE